MDEKEMAEQAETTQEPEETQDAAPAPVDWEAKYRDALRQSRKWEQRAKANSKQAEHAEQSDSELADMRDRVAALEADVKAKSVELTRSKVSAETGIPAALITGDDEEAMREAAKAIAEFAESRKPSGFPEDKGGAGKAAPMGKADILAIENPRERRAAIAANIDMF